MFVVSGSWIIVGFSFHTVASFSSIKRAGKIKTRLTTPIVPSFPSALALPPFKVRRGCSKSRGRESEPAYLRDVKVKTFPNFYTRYFKTEHVSDSLSLTEIDARCNDVVVHWRRP